jgi:hypothetical protein
LAITAMAQPSRCVAEADGSVMVLPDTPLSSGCGGSNNRPGGAGRPISRSPPVRRHGSGRLASARGTGDGMLQASGGDASVLVDAPDDG